MKKKTMDELLRLAGKTLEEVKTTDDHIYFKFTDGTFLALAESEEGGFELSITTNSKDNG